MPKGVPSTGPGRPGTLKKQLQLDAASHTSDMTECAICLEALAVPGIPLFVAECGHSFHFRFIVPREYVVAFEIVLELY